MNDTVIESDTLSPNTAEIDDADNVTCMIGDDEIMIDKFEVKVSVGPDAGLTCVSAETEFSIGKAAGNHLVLTDPAVSRHHCTITVTPRGLVLRDLGSTNGVRVNGVRVERAFLDKRSVISIGSTVIEAQQLDEKIREPLAREDNFGPLLGRSASMRRLFALIPRIAYSDSTVLLEGETGTGKGLFAAAIHKSGLRSSGPFVVVDCASIPPSLIESELFGHEKGAFTGAHEARAGAFEAAQGGTIFLDEIGELPLEMQPKLLRALEEREVKRIGSLDRVKLDVRVIAATNRDLRTEVNRQAFRSDLYYRLNVLKMRIPPLRERREDIPLLVRQFHEELGGGPPNEDMEQSFAEGTWPGNIRELRTAVERTVLLGDPRLLELRAPEGRGSSTSRGSSFSPGVPFRVAKEAATARWESEYLGELMRRYEGNISRASRGARMDRNHLRELLRRHAIPTPRNPVPLPLPLKNAG